MEKGKFFIAKALSACMLISFGAGMFIKNYIDNDNRKNSCVGEEYVSSDRAAGEYGFISGCYGTRDLDKISNICSNIHFKFREDICLNTFEVCEADRLSEISNDSKAKIKGKVRFLFCKVTNILPRNLSESINNRICFADKEYEKNNSGIDLDYIVTDGNTIVSKSVYMKDEDIYVNSKNLKDLKAQFVCFDRKDKKVLYIGYSDIYYALFLKGEPYLYTQRDIFGKDNIYAVNVGENCRLKIYLKHLDGQKYKINAVICSDLGQEIEASKYLSVSNADISKVEAPDGFYYICCLKNGVSPKNIQAEIIAESCVIKASSDNVIVK